LSFILFYIRDNLHKVKEILCYIKLLKDTNNNPNVIRAYLNFTYHHRTHNKENTQYCASVAHSLLDENEEINYVQLISLYTEIGDEKNEFKLLKYANIKMEEGKAKADIYAGLGYFYEDQGDLKNSIKYYKLYRKYNSIWYDNGAEELDKDIKEMEEKLLTYNKPLKRIVLYIRNIFFKREH